MRGLYLSHIPLLSHLDTRVEGGYTNLPGLLQPPGGGFFLLEHPVSGWLYKQRKYHR